MSAMAMDTIPSGLEWEDHRFEAHEEWLMPGER